MHCGRGDVAMKNKFHNSIWLLGNNCGLGSCVFSDCLGFIRVGLSSRITILLGTRQMERMYAESESLKEEVGFNGQMLCQQCC